MTALKSEMSFHFSFVNFPKKKKSLHMCCSQKFKKAPSFFLCPFIDWLFSPHATTFFSISVTVISIDAEMWTNYWGHNKASQFQVSSYTFEFLHEFCVKMLHTATCLKIAAVVDERYCSVWKRITFIIPILGPVTDIPAYWAEISC